MRFHEGTEHEADLCQTCMGYLYADKLQQDHEPERELCQTCEVFAVRDALAADPEIPFDGLTGPSPEPE